MKHIILIMFLIFPAYAHAYWSNEQAMGTGPLKKDAMASMYGSVSFGSAFYDAGTTPNCFISGGEYVCYKQYKVWQPEEGIEVEIPEGYTVFGHVYTDQQCSSTYSGARYLSGLTVDDITAIGSGQFPVGGGACLASFTGAVSACDSGGCWVDIEAVSSGQVADFGENAETEISEMPAIPDYMIPNENCSNNCITIDGQKYQVIQDAIDSGTVSVIDFSGGSGGDTGGGDDGGTSGGGDSGSGGGDSGSGDGTGGSGDGSGSDGGTGGGGGSGGDGTGSEEGSGGSGWKGSGEGYDGFDGLDEHQEKLADAKQRYQDAIEGIRSEVSGMFDISVGGGGGCSSSGGGTVFGSSVEFNACKWLEPVLPVLRPATMAVAAMIAAFILLGSGRRTS